MPAASQRELSEISAGAASAMGTRPPDVGRAPPRTGPPRAVDPYGGTCGAPSRRHIRPRPQHGNPIGACCCPACPWRTPLGRRHQRPLVAKPTPAWRRAARGGRLAPREGIIGAATAATFAVVLLETLAKGRDERAWSSAVLRVLFIDSGAGHALLEASAHGVHDLFDALPPLPRGDLLTGLVKADALLMPLYPSDPYHLPMRFFAFVGSGRPMIGVGSDAAPAAEMIRRHGLGFVCTDTEELVSVMDGVVRSPRAAELPLQTRRLFDIASPSEASAGVRRIDRCREMSKTRQMWDRQNLTSSEETGCTLGVYPFLRDPLETGAPASENRDVET